MYYKSVIPIMPQRWKSMFLTLLWLEGVEDARAYVTISCSEPANVLTKFISMTENSSSVLDV